MVWQLKPHRNSCYPLIADPWSDDLLRIARIVP